MDRPWQTSKLFFKADLPGQKELRTRMFGLAFNGALSVEEAQILTWAWLIEQHGGDEQSETK